MQATFNDLIGKTFLPGANGPAAYDCWALAVEVFRRFGVEVPDYRLDCDSVAAGVDGHAEKWARCLGEIPVPALVVFTTVGVCDHVGVYIGVGKFIHAHEATGVAVTRTDHPFWRRRIEGYYSPGWLNEINIRSKSDHA
jgi:cell wall-associated NlpC family hydrolase